MMKGKGSKVVKQIISMIRSVSRSKTEAMKTRLMVTALTLLSKIDGMLGTGNTNSDGIENKSTSCSCSCSCMLQELDDDDKYPDLRHSLFEEEEKELAQLLDDPTSSISAIDIVKNGNHKFNLEDEIDEVADLFITKFHKRMRLQKLLSFKRQAQA